MKRMITFFQNIRLSQVLSILLAVSLLFVSTACSTPNNNDLQSKAPTPNNLQLQEGNTEYHSRDLYEPKVYDRNPSGVPGGMNNFKDTDPRTDTKDADKQAKFLKDNAARNINQNRAENIEQLGENIKQGGRKIGEGIKEQSEEVAGRTKEGFPNYAIVLIKEYKM
ncbi:MAG: hypothetical protein HC908_02440 [Calothrix sp. SM1_7_51]|nr:hypothetical protein [Calothrix sp. SM1_7_51]